MESVRVNTQFIKQRVHNIWERSRMNRRNQIKVEIKNIEEIGSEKIKEYV